MSQSATYPVRVRPSFDALAAVGFNGEILPIAAPGTFIRMRNGLEPAEGKAPTREFRADEKSWSRYADWTTDSIGPRQLAAWDKLPVAACGIGLRTRRFPTLDCDVYDPALAQAIAAAADEFFGPVPVRSRPDQPKWARVYRTETPFVKQRIAFTLPGDDRPMAVEFLGDGQQIVLEGAYDEAGTVNRLWSPCGLDQFGAHNLPTVTADSARFFMECAVPALIDEAGGTISRARTKRSAPAPERIAVGDPRLMATDPADAVAALQAVPCEDLDYAEWIDTGRAFKAAVGGDDAYLPDFLTWCEGYEANDDDISRAKWDSFDSSTLGAEMLFSQAYRHGFDLVAVFNREIATLPRDADAKSVRQLVERIARAGLEQGDVDQLETRIRKRVSGIRAKTLRGLVSEAQKAIAGTGSTDAALAVRDAVLAACFADGRHLVCVGESQFWRFAGTHWRPELRNYVEQQIEQIIETIDLADAARDTDTLTRRVGNHLRRKVGRSGEQNPFARMRPPTVINTLSGEIHLQPDGAHVLKPHDPQSWLTTCLPVTYDPAAACPMFDAFIADISRPADADGHVIAQADMTNADRAAWADMQRHILEIFGYLIQPSRFIRSFFLFHGEGSNGKGSLIEIAQALIGPDGCATHQISKFSHSNFALGHTAGKLLFVDDDIKKGATLNDSVIKMLSEAKLLTGENKNEKAAAFVNSVALVILANSLPGLNDTSHGMRSRIHAVPFFNRFDTANNRAGREKAATIIRDELSGVLNRALAGLQRVAKRGYFDQPEPCQALAARWLNESDPLPWFWSECIEKGSPADALEMERVREAYHIFIAMQGVDGHGLSPVAFAKRVRQEFRPTIAHRRVATLTGYRLRQEALPSDFDTAI